MFGRQNIIQQCRLASTKVTFHEVVSVTVGALERKYFPYL